MDRAAQAQSSSQSARRYSMSVERILRSFLLGCVAIGVALRVLWAGKREWWYDEVLSVLIATGNKNAYRLPENEPFTVGEVAKLLGGFGGQLGTAKDVVKGTLGDPHPPLSYLLHHSWMQLLGNGEGALRSSILIISVITLGVAYLLGKRLLGQRGGLIFTALLALNPFFFAHSLNLRMYAPMALWVVISATGLLALIDLEQARDSAVVALADKQKRQLWLWRAVVVISLTAGLLTQYLFAYWVFAIAALALYLDRKRWLSYGLTIGTSMLLFAPWALWGVRQQMNNRADVLNQISAVGGPMAAAIAHSKDLAQTVANHLLLGHLTTGMMPLGEPIKPTAVAIGCGVIAFLGVCVAGLYRRREYKLLMVCVLMGLFPLAVALIIDILTNKYTLGFGWGRSTMAALPGCVLLVAAWLDRATGRWRQSIIVGLLAVYLMVNVADFGGRDRQMFHQVNAAITGPEEQSLVVMNSRAWGHVLRLAYYLGDRPDTNILATDPADVASSLETAIEAGNYAQVLWLRAEYPLWGKPESEAQAQAFAQDVEKLLQANYRLSEQQALSGTMNLDMFNLQVYQNS